MKDKKRILTTLFCLCALYGTAALTAPATSDNGGIVNDDVADGFMPKPVRHPVSDFGIMQQDDGKVQWMRDAKIGMFIHWGLFSGAAQGEWYMENKGLAPNEYRRLAYPGSGNRYFDASRYNADEWMRVAKAMGARYTVLTTMHHDGFALFDSHYMNAFNSVQTLNRDLVAEYVGACRKAGMRVGFYKTLINWRYPGYYDVNGTDCKANKFGYSTAFWHKENARLMKEELYCDTRALMTQYGKIDLMFWDGGWIAQQGSDRDGAPFWEPYRYVEPDNQWPVNPYFLDTDSATGRHLGLIGMVRKYQPDILMNPRSGWMGDYFSAEGSSEVKGKIRTRLEEKCLTLTPAWGYTAAAEDPKRLRPAGWLKQMLANCVVRDMNLLVNVGPDRHGHIPDAEAAVLAQFGKWVGSVAEAVYATTAGPWQPVDNQYGFTCRGNKIYVWLLGDLKGQQLTLPPVSRGYRLRRAYMVGTKAKVKASQKGRRITIDIAAQRASPTVIALEMNKAVWP